MTDGTQGRIAALYTHPIKGCRAVALQRARLRPTGLRHDREWMVVDANGDLITQREAPRLATVRVEVGEGGLTLSADGLDPVAVPYGPGDAIPVRVWRSRVRAQTTTPEADAFFSRVTGAPSRLARFDPTERRECDSDIAPGDHTYFADGYPVLVTNAASLDRLNGVIAEAGHAPVPMARFRPNIVVDGIAADLEDRAGRLRIGDEVGLDLVKPCDRCEVTTIDQETGERRPREPLASLAKIRMAPGGGKVLFGQNGVPRLVGDAAEIAVGDAVAFLDLRN